MTEPERLQRALARAGFGSRRSCEDLIRDGRVSVNGKAAELGVRVNPTTDIVKVDDVAVSLATDLVYLALHKPVGFVTTARDPQERETVLDLVPPEPRVFPVGRLDRDTSGLLLMTNDGDFANRVTHPRYEVPKTYVAEVRGTAKRSHVSALTVGVELDDGVARADRAVVKASRGGRSVVELDVREGRNRLVRRMLDAVGLPVTALVRTAIGPVSLGRLRAGTYRKLARSEVLEVLRAVQSVD